MVDDIQLPIDSLDKLKQAKANVEGVKKFLQKAKMAGIDVSSKENIIRDQERKINKLRDGFFPGKTL